MNADRKPIAVHFGNNLRICRRRAGISQETLGRLTSLHRSEIGMLERGAREPRLGTVVKLAGALSVPLKELVGGISWTPEDFFPGQFEFHPADDGRND